MDHSILIKKDIRTGSNDKIELKELRKEAAERAAKQRETAGGTQE